MFQGRLTKAQSSSNKQGPLVLLVLLAGASLVGALLLLLTSSSLERGNVRASEGEFWLALAPGPDDGHGVGHRGLAGKEYGGGSEISRRMLQQGPPPGPAPVSAPVPVPVPAPEDITPTRSPAPSLRPNSAAKTDDGGGLPRGVLLAVTIGTAAFLVVFAAVVVAAGARLVARKRKLEGGLVWKRGISNNENEELAKPALVDVPSTTVEELEAQCEEYTNVIGRGTDFTIFKGTRPSDDLQIAVTKLHIAPGSWTIAKEIAFRGKVEDLARMRHDNLLNLLAYCASEHPFERILVFEYASNGTLYDHLHGNRMAADHLDWPTRMRIVMGTAYGLQYMHHELDPPTAHFKFDAGHVFLTEDYAAKVSDLGIPASAHHTHADRMSLGRRRSFSKIVRTMGYSDWDGFSQTPSLDTNIRSFGVFLLEVVTGRPSYTETQGPLIEWAKNYLHDPAAMTCLVDPSLQSHDRAELGAICEVIRLCLQPRTSKQLTMKEVTDMLSKALRMTRDKANRKRSPLLWAEMQIMGSMDRTSEDGSFSMNVSSPRQRPLGSPGAGRPASPHQPAWAATGGPGPVAPDLLAANARQQHHRRLSSECSESEASSIPGTSPRQSTSSAAGAPNRSAGAGAGPRHFLQQPWIAESPERQDDVLTPADAGRGEEPEAPLAFSHPASSHSNSSSLEHFEISSATQESISRSFRRVWAENSADSDFYVPQWRFKSDTLGR